MNSREKAFAARIERIRKGNSLLQPLRDEKVTVQEIREFILNYQNTTIPDVDKAWSHWCRPDILAFINNGPKKPTAEDILEKASVEILIDGRVPSYKDYKNHLLHALREAGLLKETND